MTTPNSAVAAAGDAGAAAAAGTAAAGADTSAAGAAADKITAGETSLLGNDGKPGEKPGEGGDGKPAEGQKKDDAKPTDAPEAYTDFTVPEGFEIDKAALETFTPLAKELNLSQEQAQKLVDWDIARSKAADTAQTAQWNEMVAGWQKAAKTDKEVGGQNFDANLGLANGVINKFGTPELKTVLKETMVGNHVELVRIFAKIGKALGEGSIETGSSAGGGEISTEQALFPTMFKK